MKKFTHIRKRDGRLQSFQRKKITAAIDAALKEVGMADHALADALSRETVDHLQAKNFAKVIDLEKVQDAVEHVLVRKDLTDAAKAYILSRQRHADARLVKRILGVEDELKLSLNAIRVLERRYLAKDTHGRIVESPLGMFQRVARAVAEPDLDFGGRSAAAEAEGKFLALMADLEFFPNSPTLMNGGTDVGQLAACFTLPVDDSMESIFGTLKHMALIHQSGGGTGFSFSHIRPKGDVVQSTQGIASGPVSFMSIYDAATDVIRQGGRRRGANMGILRIDHPDIMDFINAKRNGNAFRNFNLSVAVTDAFMNCLRRNGMFSLVNPRTRKVQGHVRAREIFRSMVTSAWEMGDPGVLFIDTVNRRNPTPALGKMESTNPCGEVPLLPYESCNLGSINLARMVCDGAIDWQKLERVVRTAVHFLDNVIEANSFPLPQIESVTKTNRKIGLGVMGLADLFLLLGVPYHSEEARKIGTNIMKFITQKARNASADLGRTRGSFPHFQKSIWPKRGFDALRNATTTTIAPTGTISLIAGASSGIEPLFALSFRRYIMEGTELQEVHPIFERMLRERNIYSQDLLAEVAHTGSIRGIKTLPRDVRNLFVTSMDISPKEHVTMQASFQRFVDNAVSKTVNLPQNATLDHVRHIYHLAYTLKCKGITVYRFGSKRGQPVSWGRPELALEPEETGACSPERCFY
ncbi:MAG: adenosylcobalamin-dependent ribonucleoside-diphosphate reductase [Gemmatimonadota bacterium]|nr:MAG: adenosylcobalamin-dependent ribonucleoside-diphosphate reductase [Gemmatimonadota bacterium]